MRVQVQVDGREETRHYSLTGLPAESRREGVLGTRERTLPVLADGSGVDRGTVAEHLEDGSRGPGAAHDDARLRVEDADGGRREGPDVDPHPEVAPGVGRALEG
jgi:hypothetical protein